MLKPSSFLPEVFCSQWMLLIAFAFSLQAGEIVYENVDNYLGRYANEKREYGDEIELAGTARTITDFAFEYYGDFVSNADEAAKIRFYKNDNILNQYQVGPGTLLFETGWFVVKPGHNSRRITGLNVTVPNNFTFTIEFKGLTMKRGDDAGLVFYHPITVGNSYDDFWLKEPIGRWALYGYQGIKNNFAVQVTAVNTTPTARIESIRKEGSSVIISTDTRLGYDYKLERRQLSDSGPWNAVQTIPGTGVIASFSPVLVAGSSSYFRVTATSTSTVVQITGIRKEAGGVVISTQTRTGLIYRLEQRNAFGAGNWTTMDAITGTGALANFVAIPSTDSTAFYRVVAQ